MAHHPLPAPTAHEYRRMEEYFDPMRLKILVMPKAGANPFGKNPDHFFIQGIDYLNARDVESAVKCFEKGVNDKSTHFLCRFNLGYTLFKIGHFQAAVQHYEILSRQCLELKLHPQPKIPAVLFNKCLCELQAGMFSDAAKTAAKCGDLMKELEKASGGNILALSK